MQCPTCQVTLQMADRQGVEIDYCPQCRGVWLDRGELEKLIDRSVEFGRPGATDRDSSVYASPYRDRDRDRDDDDRYPGHYKKRESWLSRLLDFD